MNRRLNHGLVTEMKPVKHTDGQVDRTRREIDCVQIMEYPSRTHVMKFNVIEEMASSGYKTMVGAATWIGIRESNKEDGDSSSNTVNVRASST